MTFPSEKYDESYWDKGIGSNYGGDSPAYNIQNFLPDRRRIASNIVQKIGIPKNSMSLGCGRGFLVMAFRNFGIDSYGIDISEYAIKTAPDELKERLYLGDISDNAFMMNYMLNSYELVTAFDILEHIKVPRLYTAILHVIRLAERYIMINMPVKNTDDEPDESKTSTDSTHVSIYTPSWWISKFLEIGKSMKLELREARITHNEKSYSLFALFEKYQEKTEVKA